jgi:hypothetical protein
MNKINGAQTVKSKPESLYTWILAREQEETQGVT